MRYEFKYYVPLAHLPKLRQMISPFVVSDPYAREKEEQSYTVRSIYFDTPRLSYYKEKVEGLRNRKKVRFRGYNEESPDGAVFLEIKRKYDIPLLKFRVPLSYSEAKSLMKRQTSIEKTVKPTSRYPRAKEDAGRFFYQVFRYHLNPVVLVVYEREPYLSIHDPAIRITFDKNLRSAPYPTVDGLYREKELKPCLKNLFILEVKFNDYFPAWMKPVIGILGVRQESASKYVISIDNHHLGNDSPQNVLTRSKWFNEPAINKEKVNGKAKPEIKLPYSNGTKVRPSVIKSTNEQTQRP